MLTDTSRMCGNYLDDYTADLLYDRFYDIEYKHLEKLMNIVLRTRQKITYSFLEDNLRKRKEEQVEKQKEIIYECNEDCKLCKKDVICVPMFKYISPFIAQILRGDKKYENVMAELHVKYPFVGFDKKYGDAKGVVKNEVGEYLTIYTYD